MATRFSLNDLSKKGFLKPDGPQTWTVKDKSLMIFFKGLTMVSEVYYDLGEWVIVENQTAREFAVSPTDKDFVVYKLI